MSRASEASAYVLPVPDAGHAFLHGYGPRGGVVKNIKPNQFYSRSGKLLIVDYDFLEI